jgi:hypothetical protein
LAERHLLLLHTSQLIEGKLSAVNQRLVGGYCFDIDKDFYDKRQEEHGKFERQLLAHLNQSDSSEEGPFVATRTNAIRVFEIAWLAHTPSERRS